MSQVYQYKVEVTQDMVDRNGHVNNVAYVEWMQEAAIEHAQASGCTAATVAMGASWVARSHHIEYLKPVFAGQTVTVLTWVSNFRKVRSLRKYKMLRTGDQAVVALAQTDWVLVDAKSGRPLPIPESLQATLPALSEDQEP